PLVAIPANGSGIWPLQGLFTRGYEVRMVRRCGGDEVTGDGWCVPRLFPVPRLPRFLLDTFELAFGEGVPVADVVVLLGVAWCGAAPECTEPHALTVRIETVTATISFMRLLIPGIG